MEFLFLPLVIGVMALPAPSPSAARLTDFIRLRDLAREEVYVIDTSGQERRLTIVDAGDAAVTFLVGQQSLEMSRDLIVRVDRARDGNVDGLIKGALIGLLIGSVAEGCASGSDGRYLLQGALSYGGIGYLFDRGPAARQLVYRAPAASGMMRP